MESEPNLGIYSEGTFKEKSERLDKLGVEGYKEEFGQKMEELKKNTPILPTEEVEKLKKDHEKYLNAKKMKNKLINN